MQITVEEMIGEGNKVVLRWSFQGTHRGLYQNIPVTGNRVQYTGIAMHTNRNGQVVAMVRELDNLKVLQQLGIALTE